MPAETDDDCRFTVAVAAPPMATDLDDTARCSFYPGTGNSIRRNGKKQRPERVQIVQQDLLSYRAPHG